MGEHTALYRLYGQGDTLLYVGVSHKPWLRFTQHSRYKPWWSEVASVDLKWFPSRAAALQAERDTIRSHGPLHNGGEYRGIPTPLGREAVPLTIEEARQRVLVSTHTAAAWRKARERAVERAYRNGHSLNQLAKWSSLSYETVRKLLIRRGVQLRPKHVR